MGAGAGTASSIPETLDKAAAMALAEASSLPWDEAEWEAAEKDKDGKIKAALLLAYRTSMPINGAEVGVPDGEPMVAVKTEEADAGEAAVTAAGTAGAATEAAAEVAKPAEEAAIETSGLSTASGDAAEPAAAEEEEEEEDVELGDGPPLPPSIGRQFSSVFQEEITLEKLRSIPNKPIARFKLASCALTFKIPGKPFVAFGSAEGGCYLMNYTTGKRTRTLVIPRQESNSGAAMKSGAGIWSLAFNNDGSMLAGCSDALYFWSVPEGKLLGRITGESSNCLDCCWGLGLRIAAVQGTAVRLWTLERGIERVEGVSQDCVKGKIELTKRIKSKKTPPKPVLGCAFFTATCPAGKEGDGTEGPSVAAGGEVIVSVGVDKEVRLWDVNGSNDKPVTTLGDKDDRRENGYGIGSKHNGHVFRAVPSPCCRFLLTVSSDRVPRIWNLRTNEASHLLAEAHELSVQCGAFEASSRLVVTGSKDLTARVWSVANGNCVAVLEVKAEVVGVGFAPCDLAANPDMAVVCVTTVAGMQIWELHVPAVDAPAV